MPRSKQAAWILFCVVVGAPLGLAVLNRFTADGLLALPTLAPLASPPANSAPTHSPPRASLQASPPPTLDPTETPTLGSTTTPTPTPTPTLTPTPFSLGAPRLIDVTPTLTDTTAVPTAVPTASLEPGVINIVILGSDRRPDWTDWHTDAIQIISIQPETPLVTILSIPRDLYVYIPGFWMSRINFADMYGQAYGYEGGGPALVQQTLLYNLGIPIHHYARTDFDGFIGIIDALGGIDVPVHCRLEDHWPYPDENGEYPIKTLEPGVHHMDGETALWYVRSRLTSTVFAREHRQQQILRAVWQKARRLDMLSRVPELWEQFHGLVVTDMELGDLLTLADVALRLEDRNVRFYSIGYEQVIPWTTPKGGAVYLPNWEAIQPIINEALGPEPEGRLWRALQTVEVWNGTSHPGWDLLAADRLARQGFSVVIGQADRQDYAATLLIDFTTTTKGSSIPFLQQMFNVWGTNVIHTPDPTRPAHYRLIIGADYQPCRDP